MKYINILCFCTSLHIETIEIEMGKCRKHRITLLPLLVHPAENRVRYSPENSIISKLFFPKKEK